MPEAEYEQLSFEFHGVGRQLSPKRLRRLKERKSDLLYFATLPPADVAQRIAILARDFAERYRIAGRAKRPDLMHVSLLGFDLARIPLPDLISEARQMASGFSQAPFAVSLDRAMGFADRKKPAIVLTCGEGRQELFSLRRSLAARGPGAAGRTFEPHLTFIYDKKPFPDAVHVEPIPWTVREFVLVYSHYGESRHEHLGRWPLQG